jgi:hypothetical protein
LFFALIIILPSTGNSEEQSNSYENTNTPFAFHGRLSIYVGNPTFRIWISGTKRILGVPGGDLEPAEMPKELESMFSSEDIIIYGDFKVTPLTKYEQGHMQYVRIDSAENLVILNGKKSRKK